MIGGAETSWVDWSGWGPLGVVIGVVTAVMFWIVPPPNSSLRKRIESLHPEDRKWLKDTLGAAPGIERYRLAVRALNDRLRAWFGDAWSIRAVRRCLQIALIYPFALFLLTWIASGTGKLGALQLFEIHSITYRLLYAVIVAFAGTAMYFIGIKAEHVSEVIGWILEPMRQYIPWTRRTILVAIVTVSGALGGAISAYAVGGLSLSAITIVVSIAVGFAAAFVGFGVAAAVLFAGSASAFFSGGTVAVFVIIAVGAGASVIVAITTFSEVSAATFVGALTIIVLGATFIGVAEFLAFSDPKALDLLFASFLFYILLPAINALADWVSWGVTRIFLIRAANTAEGLWGAIRLVHELLAALLVGMVFLVLLAIALATGITLSNVLFMAIAKPPVDWLSQLDAAAHDPFGQGLMIMGLLMTTVIPTFLHLAAGLAGIFLAWTPDARRLAAAIPYAEDGTPQAPLAQIRKDEIFWTLFRGRFWYLLAVPLTCAIFAGMFEAFSLTIQPYGHFLADAARCATSWSHGQCAWW